MRPGCRRASDAHIIGDPVDKKALSERDICTKFIIPAMVKGGWDVLLQVRENVPLTKGRVIVRGKVVTRGTMKFADYVLYAKPNANIPLAIVEAKDNNHSVGDGMQQGLGYADMLDVPFVFSSNGDGFLLPKTAPRSSWRPSCRRWWRR
jgi:type I restriction enzyme R subunit